MVLQPTFGVIYYYYFVQHIVILCSMIFIIPYNMCYYYVQYISLFSVTRQNPERLHNKTLRVLSYNYMAYYYYIQWRCYFNAIYYHCLTQDIYHYSGTFIDIHIYCYSVRYILFCTIL